jgi:hypothetical protein
MIRPCTERWVILVRGGIVEMKLDPYLSIERAGGSLKRLQSHSEILRVKQPIERGSACPHASGHFGLADADRSHLLREQQGNAPLDRKRRDAFEQPFLREKVIEV